MNCEHLKRLGVDAVAAGCKESMVARGQWREGTDEGYFKAAVACMGDRIKLFPDMGEQAAWFFDEEFPYDEKSVRKRLLKEGALDVLREERDWLAGMAEGDWRAETLDAGLHAMGEAKGCGMGDLVHPLRVAVSGTGVGPGLFEMLAVMGKERVLARVQRTLNKFDTGARATSDE